MMYLALYLVSIVSPFLAIAEPIVVLSAMSGQSQWLFMAVIVALGQCTSFGLLYFFGERILVRLKGLQRKLEEFDFSRLERSQVSLTALGGIFGIPPASVLAAAGPVFEPRWFRFLGVLFAGRVVRFSILGLIPTTFVSLFNPDFLPAWVRDSLAF